MDSRASCKDTSWDGKAKEGESVYDSTTGYGCMLIHSTHYIEEHGGNPRITGGELNS